MQHREIELKKSKQRNEGGQERKKETHYDTEQCM